MRAVRCHDPGPEARLLVEEVDPANVGSYGIVGVGKDHGPAFEITRMVGVPAPADAPSNLMISGRYILEPEIFTILDNQERGAGNEIQVTDAMIKLMQDRPFYGFRFGGETYDCGSKVGFLAANVAFALDRPEIEPEFREILKGILAR